MDGWMDGEMDGWTDKQREGQKQGGVDVRTNGQTDEWMDDI